MDKCMQTKEISVLYVTFSNAEEAQTVGGEMVKSRLAACMNIVPAKSCYVWQGKFETEEEIIAIFKTKPSLVDDFREKIQALHSYQVACILTWNVNANTEYADWIDENTGGRVKDFSR